MRNNFIIFLDSILALAFSWGSSYLFIKSDKEAFLITGTLLSLMCSIIIIPTAWRHLNTTKPLKESLLLSFALLPLIVTLSHPTLLSGNFLQIYSSLSLSFIGVWVINVCIYSIVIFLITILILKCLDEKKQDLLGNLYTTIFFISFFLVSLYAGFLLSGIHIY